MCQTLVRLWVKGMDRKRTPLSPWEILKYLLKETSQIFVCFVQVVVSATKKIQRIVIVGLADGGL